MERNQPGDVVSKTEKIRPPHGLFVSVKETRAECLQVGPALGRDGALRQRLLTQRLCLRAGDSSISPGVA